MTARLYANLTQLSELVGDEFISQLTYPGIYRGSALNVSPVVIEIDGARSVVISEADSDACKVLPAEIVRHIYGRYFSWDKDLTAPVATFADAVGAAIGAQSLVCDAALPVSRYHSLTGLTDIKLFDEPQPSEVFLYRLPRSLLEARWQETREADLHQAAPFIQSLPHGDRLIAAGRVSDPGFAALDSYCKQSRLDAIYITAPHEVEMFAGLPAAYLAQSGIAALFVAGSDTITLIAEQPATIAGAEPLGARADLATALRELSPAVTGYQPDHMSIGIRRLIGDAVDLQDASYVLKRWQDRRAGADIVYFIVAGNAVLHGFAAAKAFFLQAADAPLSERHLVAAFHYGVRKFARSIGFENRLLPYFDIVHSGARTFLPATAGDYPVRRFDKTIKFDMGLLATDASGCVRGCSDIARTICADPAIQAMHDRLRAVLVEDLMPAIKGGMTGAEVHAIGVDKLRPLEAQLRALGLLADTMAIDGYRRDCGHTLQRQTISTVYFLPGVTERVEVGMLGCVEYVWPIGDILLAVEDGYLIEETGAIPFTQDVEP